jgi:hypothetical protein
MPDTENEDCAWKAYIAIASLVTGVVLGAGAMKTLHAQTKPPIYGVTGSQQPALWSLPTADESPKD